MKGSIFPNIAICLLAGDLTSLLSDPLSRLYRRDESLTIAEVEREEKSKWLIINEQKTKTMSVSSPFMDSM